MVSVNDILFSESRMIGLRKVTVTKITPTGNIRVSDGALLNPQLGKKTSDAWDTTRYYIWSKELEDKFRLQNMRSDLKEKINELKVSELDENAVSVLLKALNEIKQN